MKTLFTRYLFVLLLLPVIVLLIGLVLLLEGTWRINKTVGWSWDIKDAVFFLFYLYPVYLIGYIILALFKIRTNYAFSIVHFSLILILMATISLLTFPMLSFCMTGLSFLAFILNVTSSIRFRLKQRNDAKGQ